MRAVYSRVVRSEVVDQFLLQLLTFDDAALEVGLRDDRTVPLRKLMVLRQPL